MQRDLLKNYPDLLIREYRDNGNFGLKKNQELEEVTFKSLRKDHNVFRKLYLRSRGEEVVLNLEIVLNICPFLKKLHDDLRLMCCCCAPHDQMDVILDQFSPHILSLLKQVLESGECVTNSESEMKELKDLIHTLGMSHLRVFEGLASKPSLNHHQEGEMSTDINAQNNADEDDIDSPDPTVASSAIDFNKNGQLENRVNELENKGNDLEKRVNELENKGNESGIKEVRRPKRILPYDKWEISKQKCPICQQYFDVSRLHVCTISSRKRTLSSSAEKDELYKDDTKIKERNIRDESSENNSDHELKEEYIEDDNTSEPTKKSIKLIEVVNSPTSQQLKWETSISEERKSCAQSLEESDSYLPEEINKSFPLVGRTGESSLNKGDIAYAVNNNDQREFKKCTIIGQNTRTSNYKVQFEESRATKTGPIITVAGNHLAHFESSKDELPVETRCICIYTGDDGERRFFPAVVAETPTSENENRYLIFFYDGHEDYFSLQDLRKIVDQGNKVWKDGFDDPEFIENYFKNYSHKPMLDLAKGDQVERYVVNEGRWVRGRVEDFDANLVLIDYGCQRLREWIYKGHLRLRKYVGDNSQDSEKKMLCVEGCGKEFINEEMPKSHHAICSSKEKEIIPCQLCKDANYKEQNLSEHLYRKHENLKKQMMRNLNSNTSIYTIEKQKGNWTCPTCGVEMKGNRTVVGLHWAITHQQINILYDSALNEKKSTAVKEKLKKLKGKLKKLNATEPTHHAAYLEETVNDETNLKDTEIKESCNEQTEDHKVDTDFKDKSELKLEFETDENPMSSSLGQGKDTEIKESCNEHTEDHKVTTDFKDTIELKLEFEIEEHPMSSSLGSRISAESKNNEELGR